MTLDILPGFWQACGARERLGWRSEHIAARVSLDLGAPRKGCLEVLRRRPCRSRDLPSRCPSPGAFSRRQGALANCHIAGEPRIANSGTVQSLNRGAGVNPAARGRRFESVPRQGCGFGRGGATPLLNSILGLGGRFGGFSTRFGVQQVQLSSASGRGRTHTTSGKSPKANGITGQGWKTLGSSRAAALKSLGLSILPLNDGIRAMARDCRRTSANNWQTVPRRAVCNTAAPALHVKPHQKK